MRPLSCGSVLHLMEAKRDPFLPGALLSAILLLLFLKTKALDSLINSSQALAAPAAVNKMALNQPDSLLSQQPS